MTPGDIPDADPLLTVSQLAQREGFTERQVRLMISRYGLPVYRLGGIRIRWSEYREWLASRKEA